MSYLCGECFQKLLNNKYIFLPGQIINLMLQTRPQEADTLNSSSRNSPYVTVFEVLLPCSQESPLGCILSHINLYRVYNFWTAVSLVKHH